LCVDIYLLEREREALASQLGHLHRHLPRLCLPALLHFHLRPLLPVRRLDVTSLALPGTGLHRLQLRLGLGRVGEPGAADERVEVAAAVLELLESWVHGAATRVTRRELIRVSGDCEESGGRLRFFVWGLASVSMGASGLVAAPRIRGSSFLRAGHPVLFP
jgi:hypothetical protein